MGRNFVITNSNSTEFGVKKRTVGRKFSIGPKASRFLAIVVFGALGILYLTQSTQGADRSFQVQSLSDQKSQLLEQRDQLQVEKSRLESLNEIQKQINQPPAPGQPADPNQLVPTTQVNYVK
ncbi:MAG: hypothetical protein NTW79_00080 [Candidatus Berkelbacteria bacterium]|nr:hypothetical protein [Candidatus Berkelbacteria bacterium]